MNKRSFFAILSALVVSAGTLGGFSSCNLSKANGNLPAVKDSTALFDYLLIKVMMIFIRKIHCPMMSRFIILFCLVGIRIRVYVRMGKETIF